MADASLVAFESAVGKLCADWVLDVAKLPAKGKIAIKDLSRALRRKIAGLRSRGTRWKKHSERSPIGSTSS